MTSYYIELTFNKGGPIDMALAAQLDKVSEALAGVDDVDGDVCTDLRAGRVDLCVTVEALDRPEALMKAFVAARTAVHSAVGHAGTWDSWLEKLLDNDEYASRIARSALT